MPLLALAVAVFALGLGVYALTRDTPLHAAWPALAGLAAWWPAPWPVSWPWASELALRLPSFCHTCALALATAALTGRAAWACTGWCACNVALEAAQWAGAQAWWPAAVPAWLTRGHFDPLDLAAVALGAGVAYWVAQSIRQHARSTGEGGHPWTSGAAPPWQP